MTLSTRVRYAVRLMADIAAHGTGDKPVPLKEVAAREGLSKAYLSQLTIPLRNAALLRTVWGNRGGFLLGRPAAQITVLDIAEAVDGAISIIDCAVDPSYCQRSCNCTAISLWKKLNEEIVRILSGRTVADLASENAGSRPLAAVSGADLAQAPQHLNRRAIRPGGVTPGFSSRSPESHRAKHDAVRGGFHEKEDSSRRR